MLCQARTVIPAEQSESRDPTRQACAELVPGSVLRVVWDGSSCGGMQQGHRPISGRLIIATHNPGKLREMCDLLAPFGIDAVSAGELGLGEPEETGTSFRENARIKAMAAARAARLSAFADDSGLAVDALDGAPGIYSARWAGESKDFTAAMTRVERL